MQRKSEVLPQPLGPNKQAISISPKQNDMLFNIERPSIDNDRSLISIALFIA